MKPIKALLSATLIAILNVSSLSIERLGVSTLGFAYDRAALPDYQRDARIVFYGMCDQGTVSYTTYWKKGGYILEVARIAPKGVFYMNKRYLAEAQGWEQRYFIERNGTGNILELSHEEWDEEVREGSVSYFNKLHDIKTSCSKMLVS